MSRLNELLSKYKGKSFGSHRKFFKTFEKNVGGNALEQLLEKLEKENPRPVYTPSKEILEWISKNKHS